MTESSSVRPPISSSSTSTSTERPNYSVTTDSSLLSSSRPTKTQDIKRPQFIVHEENNENNVIEFRQRLSNGLTPSTQETVHVRGDIPIEYVHEEIEDEEILLPSVSPNRLVITQNNNQPTIKTSTQQTFIEKTYEDEKIIGEENNINSVNTLFAFSTTIKNEPAILDNNDNIEHSTGRPQVTSTTTTTTVQPIKMMQRPILILMPPYVANRTFDEKQDMIRIIEKTQVEKTQNSPENLMVILPHNNTQEQNIYNIKTDEIINYNEGVTEKEIKIPIRIGQDEIQNINVYENEYQYQEEEENITQRPKTNIVTVTENRIVNTPKTVTQQIVSRPQTQQITTTTIRPTDRIITETKSTPTEENIIQIVKNTTPHPKLNFNAYSAQTTTTTQPESESVSTPNAGRLNIFRDEEIAITQRPIQEALAVTTTKDAINPVTTGHRVVSTTIESKSQNDRKIINDDAHLSTPFVSIINNGEDIGTTSRIQLVSSTESSEQEYDDDLGSITQLSDIQKIIQNPNKFLSTTRIITDRPVSTVKTGNSTKSVILLPPFTSTESAETSSERTETSSEEITRIVQMTIKNNPGFRVTTEIVDLADQDIDIKDINFDNGALNLISSDGKQVTQVKGGRTMTFINDRQNDVTTPFPFISSTVVDAENKIFIDSKEILSLPDISTNNQGADRLALIQKMIKLLEERMKQKESGEIYSTGSPISSTTVGGRISESVSNSKSVGANLLQAMMRILESANSKGPSKLPLQTGNYFFIEFINFCNFFCVSYR